MNIQTKLSASRLTVMTLACLMAVCLAACGGDDSDEPAVEESLSKETTPVPFDLTKGTHFLFDYAGNNLVAADTIDIQYSNKGPYSVDLRQGKHRLLWMRGLNGSSISWMKDKARGVDYDTSTGMVVCNGLDLYPLPQYCYKEIEVTPYLMPAQTLEYQHLCAGIEIVIYTDALVTDISKTTIAFPYIKSVGLEDNRYTTEKSVTLYLAASGQPDGRYSLDLSEYTLCPKDGLDDVELPCNIGSLALKLPRISLQRGQITKIEGLLQGNGTGDFSVTMHK